MKAVAYCEPAFQIGTTPMRALDFVLPLEERRVWERRSMQEALQQADRRHSERRFDSKPITGWGNNL